MKNSTIAKNFLISSIISMALAVSLGAFGAHALEEKLKANHRTDTYQTASTYHFYHSLGIMAISILILIKPEIGPKLSWPLRVLFLGIVLFSGSLYLLSVFNIGWWGFAPLGGISFIIGWVWVVLLLRKFL